MSRVFFEDLCSSRWRPPACSRMTLPLPVMRKRFLVPLCDFIFGMGGRSPSVVRWGGGGLVVGGPTRRAAVRAARAASEEPAVAGEALPGWPARARAEV